MCTIILTQKSGDAVGNSGADVLILQWVTGGAVIPVVFVTCFVHIDPSITVPRKWTAAASVSTLQWLTKHSCCKWLNFCSDLGNTLLGISLFTYFAFLVESRGCYSQLWWSTAAAGQRVLPQEGYLVRQSSRLPCIESCSLAQGTHQALRANFGFISSHYVSYLDFLPCWGSPPTPVCVASSTQK